MTWLLFFLSRLQVTRKFFTVLWKLWCSSVQLLVLPSTLIWRLFCHRYTTTVIFYFYSTPNQPLTVLRGRVCVVFQRGYFYHLPFEGSGRGGGLVVASFPCDLYVWFTRVGVILLGEIRCWSPLGVKGLNCEIVTRFPHLFCTSLFLRQCNTFRSFNLKSLPTLSLLNLIFI